MRFIKQNISIKELIELEIEKSKMQNQKIIGIYLLKNEIAHLLSELDMLKSYNGFSPLEYKGIPIEEEERGFSK